MKITLSLVFTFFCFQWLLGQEIPTIVPPSPNAFEMTRFSAQQPNLYTGTASFSVPLYSIDFDGWALPLSLSYQASGVKPNQEASEIGLGWALNATGVISRTILGGNDFFNSAGGTGNGNGYFHDVDDVPTSVSVNSQYWNSMEDAGFRDTRPDQFSYNFFGFSGTFVVQKKKHQTGPAYEALLINENGCRIRHNEGGTSFTIETPTGYKGTFDVLERSTSISGIASASPAGWKLESNYSDVFGLNTRGMLRSVTSWYLSKIESPYGKVINFIYNDLSSFKDNSKYVSITQPSWGEGNPTPSFRVIQEHVYLTRIEITNELRVNFQMGDRDDLQKNNFYSTQNLFPYQTSSSKLRKYTGITVDGLSASSSLWKNIVFYQSYFHYDKYQPTFDSDEEVTWMRSRLDKVTVDDQAYRFVYDQGASGLPSKSTRALDHFGYYSGGTDAPQIWLDGPQRLGTGLAGITYLQRSDRKANLTTTKVGSLTKAYLPTGGAIMYEYERHAYHVMGDIIGYGEEAANAAGDPGTAYAGGLRIKETKTSDGQGNEYRKTYHYLKSNGESSGLLMKPLHFFVYWTDNGSTVSVSVPANTMFPVNSAEGNQVGYSRVTVTTEQLSGAFSSVYTYQNVPSNLIRNLDLINQSSIIASTSYDNGKLEHIEDRDNTNAVVRDESNTYLYKNSGLVTGINYGRLSNNFFFWMPFQVSRTTPYPYQRVETMHSSTGDLISYTTTEYNEKVQLEKVTRFESSSSGTSQSTEVEYKRPTDYTSRSQTIQDMIDDYNLIDPVIETISKKNGVVVDASAVQYDFEHSNPIVRRTYRHNIDNTFTASSNGTTFGGGYEEVVTFNDYDNYGNVLQYTARDGVVNSYIWGYNNTLPIVHGTGISFSALSQAHSASVSSSNYETLIRNHTGTSSGFVTTYAYNPKVGFTSVTDPNGESTSYTYDSNERLYQVKDTDDNVVEQYDVSFTDNFSPVFSLNSSQSFGNVPFNQTAEQSFEISNSGNELLTISSVSLSSSNFSTPWTSFPILIPPESSFDFPITFVPNGSTGLKTGTITFNSPTGNQSVSLSASAVYPTRVQVIPDGCVNFSNSFSTITVEVQNSGNLPLTISDLTSDDPNVVPIKNLTGYDPVTSFPLYEIVVPPKSGSVNGSNTFQVRLQTNINNWDGLAAITIFSDKTNNSSVPDKINIRKINSPYSCN